MIIGFGFRTLKIGSSEGSKMQIVIMNLYLIPHFIYHYLINDRRKYNVYDIFPKISMINSNTISWLLILIPKLWLWPLAF